MAKVLIENEEHVCYVKSSSRLCNYVNLNGKFVFLRKNQKSKFEYYIYAVKHKKSAILLCPSYANKIVYDSIHKRMFSFLGKRNNIAIEKQISNYKADFLIDDTFIEIKSIISYEETVLFPTVYSERFKEQMLEFLNLLNDYYGYLFLICLNPYAKEIKINEQYVDFDLLKKNIEKGLIIKGFVIDFIKGLPIIKREIPITI